MPGISSQSLLAAFQRLQWLSEAKSESIDRDRQLAGLVGTSKSALLSLAAMLHTILSSNIGPRPPVQVLSAVDTLLDHLLSTIFQLIAVLLKRFGKGRSKSHTVFVTALATACDDILGVLGEMILIPLVRSLWPICQSYAKATLGKGKEKPVDVRMGLLTVMRNTIRAVDELAEESEFMCGVQNLKERIALEGIRELMAAYETSSNPRRDEWSIRANRLARKDAVWGLCDALHAVFGNSHAPRFPPQIGTGRAAEGGLLKDEVLEQMGELVRRMTAAGEAEKSMVLGVVERGWVNGLQARSQGWTEVHW